MMEPGPKGAHVREDGYRRRRRADALKLLPVLGLVVFMLPLMWIRGPGGMSTANALIYLFLVWVLMILLARFFAARLARDDSGDPRRATAADGGPEPD